MSKSAAAINALSIGQIENAIRATGHKRTSLVRGHMGTGKSSLLSTMAKKMPTHRPFYFDCTTKDLGDITIPNLKPAGTVHYDYVSYATNEELGVHLKQPIILMVDEFGKANPAVKNALLRLLLERKIGAYTLHEDSIVFATTNLGSENVGDLLPAHARNRMTMLNMRKPTNEEWIEWAILNNIDHTIIMWCKENPQLFYSFEDCKPDENPYIYHPKRQDDSFVTPRSLEAASDWCKSRGLFDNQSLQQALMGTIGARGAMDLNAYISMADELPTLDSIKNDPLKAKVPKNGAATCMVVYRTLTTLEDEWTNSWMTYMNRLEKEAQALFAKNATMANNPKRQFLVRNKKFGEWCLANAYMMSADSK